MLKVRSFLHYTLRDPVAMQVGLTGCSGPVCDEDIMNSETQLRKGENVRLQNIQNKILRHQLILIKDKRSLNFELTQYIFLITTSRINIFSNGYDKQNPVGKCRG